MTYKQTLDFMFSKLPMYQRQGDSAYKANLETSLAFDDYLKNPHKNYKTIHIAGTNGKGSVSHMLASILQSAGYKVGLYTSPHLKDYRERIKINGLKISEEYVIKFVSKNNKFILKQKPSFFEMTAFMAFEYFASEKIDIAVIEVGMGGRLDSTNVINPILSIITNIGLDHTKFLGNNLNSIAVEKAGVIKHKTPVIIGKTQAETKAVFLQKAKENNSEIFFADDFYTANYSLFTIDNLQNIFITNNFTKSQKNYFIDLLGDYQKENIITVLKAYDVLKNKITISDDDLKNGIKNTVKNTELLGRWQILSQNPKIICDTGHNYDGIKFIVNQINNTPYKNLHLVLGFVNDKDYKSLINLFPKTAKYYLTKANIPRSLNEDELCNYASSKSLDYTKHKTVSEALANAKNNALTDDLIFIGGSTFIVAEVL